MAEHTLYAEPPLAGTELHVGEVSICSPHDLAIVALALPRGREDAAGEAIAAGYGRALPAPGKSAMSGDGERLLRLGRDQAFVLFTGVGPHVEARVRRRLGGAVYITDQSDAWSALEVSGTDSRAMLERICPVDLDAGTFAEDDVTRTVMGHLGVIILRNGSQRFLLLSPASSAQSFLEMLTRAAHNLC